MSELSEILPSSLIELLQAAGRSQRAGRPFVTLSYTQSLDGCITDKPGKPFALSGAQSLALAHHLRAGHDAVLVGIGTVLADNPRLNVRLVEGRNPQPVVVDSSLRVPLNVNLFQSVPPWIATTDHADDERQRALEAVGACVLRLPTDAEGRVNLTALLQRLGELGINRLLVEGGARIITSFLSARLVDRLVLTVAPVILGGLHAVGKLEHVPRLDQAGCQRLGDDWIVWGDLA